MKEYLLIQVAAAAAIGFAAWRTLPEIITMIALGIIVLLLGAYLVYALVHPERF